MVATNLIVAPDRYWARAVLDHQGFADGFNRSRDQFEDEAGNRWRIAAPGTVLIGYRFDRIIVLASSIAARLRQGGASAQQRTMIDDWLCTSVFCRLSVGGRLEVV